MTRTSGFQFGLPRFQGAVRNIILLTLGIWFAIILLFAFDRPDAAVLVRIGQLDPAAIMHGAVWQFFTYTFIHIDPRHILFSLLAIYFIGSAVQDRLGSRAFAELYIGSSLLAGIAGFLLSLTGHVGAGTAMGAGAAANGVLMVFYLLYRGASIFMFPLPFQIPVLWVVVAIGGIETAYFVLTGFSQFYLVQLLGLGTGYIWFRFLYRRSAFAMFQGGIIDLRNRYYRWKRRRAGKKFEVYMRKHEHDPKQYFDEYGNFKPPGDKDKEDRGKGGWVN